MVVSLVPAQPPATTTFSNSSSLYNFSIPLDLSTLAESQHSINEMVENAERSQLPVTGNTLLRKKHTCNMNVTGI